MEKTERFGLVLTPPEKAALQRLADRERLSSAAVVRRLIWNAAEERGLLDAQNRQNQTRTVEQC